MRKTMMIASGLTIFALASGFAPAGWVLTDARTDSIGLNQEMVYNLRGGAGVTYYFTVEGVTLRDPVLEVRDMNGRVLATFDDTGDSLNPEGEWAAPYTGSFQVVVLAYNPRTDSGQYVLRMWQWSN